MSHHMVPRPYDLSTMAAALRSANDGPPGESNRPLSNANLSRAVFRTLEETRERTAALRLQVDQGRIPLVNEDALAETVPEEESQYDELKRRMTAQEKRITDLEVYSKLQTCAIEELFSVCNSLQFSSEKVQYMRTYFVLPSNLAYTVSETCGLECSSAPSRRLPIPSCFRADCRLA